MFNIFTNVVLKEVEAKVKEQGTSAVYGSERKWEVGELLSADDTALFRSGRQKQQNLVTECGECVV